MSRSAPDASLAGFFAESSLVVAPALLGATLVGRGVALRITEVEAYTGADDPGSHGHRGVTPRNRHLFGPGGHLYAYRSYGIHTCVNVVSGPAGVSSGSLIRAGEVVGGVALARSRRGPSVSDVRLAQGPGNVGTALGAVLGSDDGTSLLDGSGPFRLVLADGLEARLSSAPPAAVVEALLSETLPGDGRGLGAGPGPGVGAGAGPGAGLGVEAREGVPCISRGPRTGIRGVAGGAGFPWRFWLTGDPTVSTYRRHKNAID